MSTTHAFNADALHVDALHAEDRARCATMSRWLAAACVTGALALGCAVVIALGYIAHAWRDEAMGFALLVLVLTPLERYLALRLRFDAGLFADLASGRIADLTVLDAGLVTLGVRKTPQPPRSLDDRLRGSLRLSRFHAIVAVLIAACTMIAVVFG
jgi:hypothetical protein